MKNRHTQLELLCIVSLLLPVCLISMELSTEASLILLPKEVLTGVVASCEEKNTIRRVCKDLRDIASPDNDDIFLCSNLVLKNPTYYFQRALYNRKPIAMLDNLIACGTRKDIVQYLDISLCELSSHANKECAVLLYDSVKCGDPLPLDPALVAAYYGDINHVRHLLSSNCIDWQLATTNWPQYTILHLAVASRKASVVAFLLEQKEVKKIIDEGTGFDNTTALDLARKLGLEHIAEMIEAYKDNNGIS